MVGLLGLKAKISRTLYTGVIQQLRELERDNVVNRNVFSKVPPHVEYAFSDYGRSLTPVLQALCDWGESHLGVICITPRKGKFQLKTIKS